MNASTEAKIAIEKLTANGRSFMQQVGLGGFSFFDDGIVAESGSWGACLSGEMHAGTSIKSSSGIMNATKKLGLWTVLNGVDYADEGGWWELTELGAEVANLLATAEKGEREEPMELAPPVGVIVKTGRKWTTVTLHDGTLIAEVRNDQFAAVAAALFV